MLTSLSYRGQHCERRDLTIQTGTAILFFTKDHYHLPRGSSSQEIVLSQQLSSGPELRLQLGQFWMSFADSC